MSQAKTDKSKKANENIEFLKCFVGIFISYWLFGLIQEWITRTKYGANKERFTYTSSLVFFQCLVNTLVSKILTNNKSHNDTTKVWMFPVCALTYLLAMLASNEALQHVSYPTQVIGKSIKPVPVMLFGVLIAAKRYHLFKYVAILMVVVGIVLFMQKDQVKDDPLPNHQYALLGFGEILLLISLGMDGLTGAVQDKMNSNHKTDPHTMMYRMNLWSCLYLFIIVIITGEIVEFVIFSQKFPVVIGYMLLLSLFGAIGQHFIFTTITKFGPLKCSLITTTRKFFTVLASVFIFSNPMSIKQWIGTILVFIGLAIDSKYGKEIRNEKEKDLKKVKS